MIVSTSSVHSIRMLTHDAQVASLICPKVRGRDDAQILEECPIGLGPQPFRG